MRPAWRLATSSLFERPSRTLLLAAVVAAAAVLIAAVGVAFGSLNKAVRDRVGVIVGSADLHLRPSGRGGTLDASLLEAARAWPETQLAAGRFQAPLALRFSRPVWTRPDLDGSYPREILTLSVTADGQGFDPLAGPTLRPIELIAGRLPAADDEIVLDQILVNRLSEAQTSLLGVVGMQLLGGARDEQPMKADPGPARAAGKPEADRLTAASVVGVGDWVEMPRFRGTPLRLRVVGIAASPPLGGSAIAHMTLDGLRSALGKPGALTSIEVKLLDSRQAQAIADARRPELPRGATIQTTELVTSGLDRNLQSNQMGFFLASMLAFLAASFIIMTGLATNVTERQRELGILRCIGASPGQLARTQLLVGGLIGAMGAAVGVPVGIAAAWALMTYFQEELRAGVILPPDRIAFAFFGSVAAGLIGASWPAWQATRVSPLKALAVRSVPPRTRTIAILTGLGLLGITAHLLIFTLGRDADTVFKLYVALGVPGLMVGYFLLGVPAVLVVVRLLGPAIARALGLPRQLLGRTVLKTPYRFGFTAGAMMAGLALMVAIWTQGSGVMRDWISKIEFPDAFVVGLNLSPESQRALEALPFVNATSAIGIQPIDTEQSFGVSSLTAVGTSFVGFEPDSFFRMVRLDWLEGDEAYARRRLDEGGAVIVAREFRAAKNLGAGDTFVALHNGQRHEFEIVGVVTSPGLEMVNEFFRVDERFTEQNVHAVFGNRRDMREKLGSDAIGLIQIDLDESVPDEEALTAIRQTLLAAGVLDAGSGREIKRQIQTFVDATLLISSSVAVFAMLVACFGVANLIIAGVQARRFEFGVLRAVGAPRGLVTRLVLAEAIIIAIAACVLGTLMGVQGAFGGTRLNTLMWGLELGIRPPVGPIAVGWLAVFLFTLGAAAPAVLALGRKHPRELLASMRG